MRGTVIKKNLKKFRKARTFMCLYENKERKKEMKDKLKKILDEAMAQIDSSDRLDRLNEIKVSFLGKKGELTSVLKAMKDVAPEDRPKVGQLVNEARKTIEERLDEKREIFEKAILDEKLKSETIDVTLPGKKLAMGHSHPNTITLEEVEDIFVGMGYELLRDRRLSMITIILRHSISLTTTLQKMNRIHSILQRIYFFVRRHLQFRYMRWKKESFP